MVRLAGELQIVVREADRAVAVARRNNPAADHAAQAIVIYDLQRNGAPGLGAKNGDLGTQKAPAPPLLPPTAFGGTAGGQ